MKTPPTLIKIKSLSVTAMSLLHFFVSIMVSALAVQAGIDQDPRYRKLSWFLHITDIHLSQWGDRTRETQFRTFATDVLAVIQARMLI